MQRPSTKNLDALPNPTELQRICKSISAIEAILCPEWEDRYFSYQKQWSEKEECCEIRNGQGDQMLILFSPQGTVINGFAHESSMNGWQQLETEEKKSLFQRIIGRKTPPKTERIQHIWSGVTSGLPQAFQEFIFGEPVRSIGTTFCIWASRDDREWAIGDITFPEDDYSDGSKDLLALLDGDPVTYRDWAIEYYELDELDLESLKSIYNQQPITEGVVNELNPDLQDIDRLKSDLEEIGVASKL
ncbi:hypothetical protein [Tunicatimonas pelagia]|uniref:hypothetical protein n=1 Tax=Tunicatimonas pelagia TaxID=931531 RepID=UPI0026668101|nr:hypothetical protein [Tunicatimonas pelagia]WKN43055.1 hypothetical protein P0M28_28870 [Tunicatimonas pelagia]